MISCRRTEIRSAHLALKGRPTVGDKGLKTPSSADNRLIDTTQTAREESEIFIRKPEVRDPRFGEHWNYPQSWGTRPYGLRAWIEQGFKITKRAGWQWQRTQMTKPERAARLWLAVAVATLWLLSVGGEAEETMPASTVPDVTALVPAPPRTRRATRLRLVSVFRRGWHLILVALLDQAPLPLGRFVPEPWPAVPAQQTPSLPVPAPPQAA